MLVSRTPTMWLEERDPSSSEEGVITGDFWLNTSNQNTFICYVDTPNSLEWRAF
jgi:hypothetical protein